jgi:hypothetical protein
MSQRVLEVPALKTNDAQPEAPPAASTANPSTTVSPGMAKLIVDVPVGETTYKLGNWQTTADLRKPKGVKLHQGHSIVGPYIQLTEGQ